MIQLEENTMLPTALEIEDRWLYQYLDALRKLLTTDDLEYSTLHCDFTKEIQTKLRVFDHDASIHASLIKEPLSSQEKNTRRCPINPRRCLLTATRDIFRDLLRGGGIDYKRSMHGIVLLDQVERHRVVLFNTVQREMAAALMDVTQSSVLLELHNASTLHYGLFHMGFRAAVCTGYLSLPAI